jgi:predicted Fe-S protein YdhL (DUF1289 family)
MKSDEIGLLDLIKLNKLQNADEIMLIEGFCRRLYMKQHPPDDDKWKVYCHNNEEFFCLRGCLRKREVIMSWEEIWKEIQVILSSEERVIKEIIIKSEFNERWVTIVFTSKIEGAENLMEYDHPW